MRAGCPWLHELRGRVPGRSHAWARPDVLARRLNVRVADLQSVFRLCCNVLPTVTMVNGTKVQSTVEGN